MSQARSCDVLVIGGGPAGSTTAALLRKYNPRVRVILVEAAPFPRYHIGESLVLEVNRILAEMGALEAVEKAGFLKKGGATYVWGVDRVPWSLRFEESTGRRPHFEGLSDHTFHVERARFDRILLECARDHGTEVIQPAKVTAVRETEGRISGAEVELDSGEKIEIAASWVVDASGRAGVVARKRGKRVFDPLLRNVATFGYLRGARVEEDYAGSWERARICVTSTATGWSWFIPMEPGVVSVGAVTSAETWRQEAKADPEAFFWKTLNETPELRRWTEGSQLVDFHHAPQRIMVESDFNYFHDTLWGPGYALVGDAAGFLDPLFTFGVFLSMTSARLLAYALGTLLDPRIPAPEDRVLGAYQGHMRSYFDAFRAMLYVFYAFNSTKESFWLKTRELMRGQALPADMSDREAFMAATFGFGVNTLLFHECLQTFGQVSLHRIRDMLLGDAEGAALPERLNDPGQYNPSSLSGDVRPSRIAPYTVEASSIPLDGTGRLVPMSRLTFTLDRGELAPFPRSIFMPDAWVQAIERMDGQTRLADLVASAAAQPVPPYLRGVDASRFLRHAVSSLVGLGAVRAS